MANAISNVGFASPGFDYGADLADIERKRALAAALQQQSMDQGQGTQVVNGWAVRNPTMPWGKLAQAAAGSYGQKRASEEQRTLAEKAHADYRQMLATGLKQLQGTPATKASEDASGNVIPASAAQPADPAAALGTFGSHPMGAQFAPLAMQQVQQQQRQKMLADVMRGGGTTTPQEGGMQYAGGQQPQGGNPTNMLAGMPPQVIALMTSGDPELVKLGTTLMEANKGIAQRPGAPVVNAFTGEVIAQPTPSVPAGVALQVGPGGPQAYPVPGAIPAMAATAASQAGATEAGKAPYQLMTANTQGAPTMMTHQQAIQAATGQPMPQPGAQPQQPMGTTPAPLPGSPDYSAFKQVQSGQVPTAYIPQQPNTQPTGGLRLQDQGESASQHAGGAAVGKFFGETYSNLQQGAMDANSKLNKLSRMEQLLKDVDTGKLTPAGTNIAAYMQSLGMNIDKNLPNKQAAEVLTNEIALQARNPSGGAGMPGSLSDADRNFLSSMTPGLAKTPEARQMIMDTSRKLAQRDQEVAKLARDYYKAHGNSLDNGFYDKLQEFANANPLFKNENIRSIVQSGKLSPQEQQELDTLRARFGRRP